MRNVAIVSFAQTPYRRRERNRSEVEMVMSVVSEAVEKAGIPKAEIEFTCSGSSDCCATRRTIPRRGNWPKSWSTNSEDRAWTGVGAATRSRCRGPVSAAGVRR